MLGKRHPKGVAYEKKQKTKNKQGLALEVSGTQIPAGLSGYSVHCEVEEGYQP